MYNMRMRRVVSAVVCGLIVAAALIGVLIVAGLVWASGYGLYLLWCAYRRRRDHARLRRAVAAHPGPVGHVVTRSGGVLAVQHGPGPFIHLRVRDVHLADRSWTDDICQTTSAWLDAGPYTLDRSPDGDRLSRDGRSLGEHLIRLGLAAYADTAPVDLREPQAVARLRQLGQWSPAPSTHVYR